MSGWIGVDLDGTLAFYKYMAAWDGSVGEPVPSMLERVKQWLAEGIDVRIMTARVAEYVFDDQQKNDQREVAAQRAIVEAWCVKHLGRALPITCQKDYGMVRLYDDRSAQVVTNTGFVLEELPAFADVIEALTEAAKDPVNA